MHKFMLQVKLRLFVIYEIFILLIFESILCTELLT